MPKTSAIERNKKRIRLVEKHAAKRAELKAVLANPATTDDEFFAAQKKLAKLPRNSSKLPASAIAARSAAARAASTAVSASPASHFASSRSQARSRASPNPLGKPISRRKSDMIRRAHIKNIHL